jgi:hypothetical protein
MSTTGPAASEVLPSAEPLFVADGGCACRRLRYRIRAQPLFVHCCHCRWCQRESGAAFALNALVESDRVELLTGVADLVDTPSESGRGQLIPGSPAVPQYYDRDDYWPAASLARHTALRPAIAAWRASRGRLL